MMWPSAVKGHMPFVDEYKKQQIEQVLEKQRARHHSGPDSRSRSAKESAKHRNTHSMPILWQSVYAGQRPRFISMPTLPESHNYPTRPSHSAPHGSHKHSEASTSKNSKHSIMASLKSVKKFFSGKRDDSSDVNKHVTSGAIVQGNSSRPYRSPSKNKKPADSDVAATSGGRSPKRQRMRTVSTLTDVMETIEEVNEVLASTDHLSDSEDSASSLSDFTGRSVASAPELTSTDLFYSCANLSNFSDSSSGHHGSPVPDIICVS